MVLDKAIPAAVRERAAEEADRVLGSSFWAVVQHQLLAMRTAADREIHDGRLGDRDTQYARGTYDALNRAIMLGGSIRDALVTEARREVAIGDEGIDA